MVHTELPYLFAQAQCESDGTFLAISRSEAEKDFILGLIPREYWILIGINVIEKERVFRIPYSCHLMQAKYHGQTGLPVNQMIMTNHIYWGQSMGSMCTGTTGDGMIGIFIKIKPEKLGLLPRPSASRYF